jgi:hypothetical protein
MTLRTAATTKPTTSIQTVLPPYEKSPAINYLLRVAAGDENIRRSIEVYLHTCT